MKEVLRTIVVACCYAAFVWASGEFLIRGISAIKPVYSVEMVKYVTTFQMRPEDQDVPHVHRPNVRGTFMGVEVSLNSLGHRSRELTQPKPENERRMFVLGSSITLGWGVPQDKVFTEIVENRLNSEGRTYKYTVVNAGIANYNTLYQVRLFKRQVDIVQPDAVVLNVFVRDAEVIPFSSDNLLLRHSLFLAFIVQQWKSLTGRSLAEHYTKLYEDGQPGWEQSKQSVRELKSLCDARGIPLVVMLTPSPHNLDKSGPFPALYDKIIATYRGMGIDTINNYPAFDEEYGAMPSNLWVAPGDPHPNHLGHKIMADELYQYVAASVCPKGSASWLCPSGRRR